jgi:hypothetical protein
MSRKLKFRLWNEFANKMIYPNQRDGESDLVLCLDWQVRRGLRVLCDYQCHSNLHKSKKLHKHMLEFFWDSTWDYSVLDFQDRSWHWYEIMQHTWFKDKDWKDVYEWDLIWYDEEDDIFEIRYVEHLGMYRLFTVKWAKDSIPHFGNWVEAYSVFVWSWIKPKVVGNIYENRDLLPNEYEQKNDSKRDQTK